VAVTEISYFPSVKAAMMALPPLGIAVAKFTAHAPLPFAVVV